MVKKDNFNCVLKEKYFDKFVCCFTDEFITDCKNCKKNIINFCNGCSNCYYEHCKNCIHYKH